MWWAVTIDSEDPRRQAEFWGAVLGCEVQPAGTDRPGWYRLQPRGPEGPFVNLQPAGEPKTGKVRIHLDVLVDDLEAAVARVVALGGVDRGSREHLPRGRIAVLQDPEGNEFCLLAPPTADDVGSTGRRPLR